MHFLLLGTKNDGNETIIKLQETESYREISLSWVEWVIFPDETIYHTYFWEDISLFLNGEKVASSGMNGYKPLPAESELLTIN